MNDVGCDGQHTQKIAPFDCDGRLNSLASNKTKNLPLKFCCYYSNQKRKKSFFT